VSPSHVINLANFPTFQAINLLTDPGYDRADHVIPNCVQVVLNWSLEDGRLAHNVLHGRVSGSFTPTAPVAQAIFSGLSTSVPFTTWNTVLAPTTSFTGVSLRDLRVANQPLVTSTGAAVVGTGAGESLPNEMAAVVTLRTNLAGRSARGRIYTMGYTAVALAPGNVIAPGPVASLGNWAATIAGVFSSNGLTFCLGLPHRLAYVSVAGTPHAERLATTVDVTSTVVRDNHWDSQRRRGLK
jgi:hypothetical protein